MASSSDYPDGRKSPVNRKVPHSLSTSFFSKGRKGSDARSPTIQSPVVSMKGPSRPPPSNISVAQSSLMAFSGPASQYDHRTEPIAIPDTIQINNSSYKQKKLAPSMAFNTHYRTISKSMNDLGNIFSRGRSPPHREISPRRPAGPTIQENAGSGMGSSSLNNMNRRNAPPELHHTKSFEPSSVPSISVMQHGDHHLLRRHKSREGWLNVIDSNTKKANPRDSWKLHYAMICEGQLLLYKVPSSFQIRAFEIGAGPPSPQRPQSAPTISSPTFNVSSLRHKSTARHPDLVLGEYGAVNGGTVEALCHELIFTQDAAFVYWAARCLSGWTGPETALSVLLELSAIKDSSQRIGEILQILSHATPGLLLEDGCYNCARLLAEKGIGPHNPDLANTSRIAIERARGRLQKPLNITNLPEEPLSPLPEAFTGLSKQLSSDEFLRIDPEIFATQVQLFHLKYAQIWSPANDISLLLVSSHLPIPSHRNPLVFSTSSIHFLGGRVFSHILCGESVHNIEHRVAVLSQWIDVARILRENGDMVGFVAITMAVLSPPILRLRETWSSMPPDLIEKLKKSGGSAMRVLERRKLGVMSDDSSFRAVIPNGAGREYPCADAVPFFGDLLHCMDEAYASRDRNIDFQKMVQGLEAIQASLASWRTGWVDLNPHFDSSRQIDTREVEQIQSCLQFLNSNNQEPPSNNSVVYFEKSLACEPSYTGVYLQSHYHQKLPLSTGVNVPLIFTDIRASFSLFDRSDTLAISGTLNRKTTSPSSGLGPPGNSSNAYPTAAQSNQNLRPPTSHGQPQIRRTRSFPPTHPSGQTTGYDDLDFTTRERTAVLHGGDNAMLRAIRDVAGVDQQLFNSKDGELVLKAITDDDSVSRPTSVIETTSKRQSVVSRRFSQIHSANVSPRVSMNMESYSIPNTPLREGFDLDNPVSLLVVPKGGTLERLVDILVLGVEDFSKRMNRSDEENADKPQSLLRMNMDVFTITFFATFRSYCSPVVLIDYLKKRLLGSKSAASFSGDESGDVVFPDWTGVDHVKDDTVDWGMVAKIHLGILDAVNVWITEFYMDFHCDQYLGESFISFLESATKELNIWKTLSPDKMGLEKAADDIFSLWQEITEKFSVLTFTPSTFDSPSTGKGETFILNIPHPDNVGQISEFVEILDIRTAEFFNSVKLVDWMFAFELLEAQSAEPMGFFIPKFSLLSHDEEDNIQDIFFLLEKLRRGNTQSNLLQSLPKSLRDLCTLHLELTNWILAQVVEPKISIERRSHRIGSLLKAITICQQRMAGMALIDNSESVVSRQVPSFVGSAIANALVRPESRLFNYSWQLGARIANGSGSQYETLEQLIPTTVDWVIPQRPLTTSVGWMIERLLEIVCHVPNMVVENNRLINFDKRRYVYNFINNFTNETENHVGEVCRRSSQFSLETETFDVRGLRDYANKENQYSRHGRVKLFWKLLQQEQEKLRRDAKQREAMERQQRHQLRAEHRRQPTNAMRVDMADKKSSNKRLAVHSIIKAVRPISMAFTSGWTPPQNALRIVPPSELPSFRGIDTARRPVATIDLKQGTSISCPRKSREKGLWKITPGTGNTTYLLQAPSEHELDEWLKIVTAIRGVHITEGAESIDLLTVVSHTRIPQPVFKVGLEELCKRDNVKIPIVVEGLLSEIEMRGLSEVGLYRVPGSLASINDLKKALDSGEDVKMDDDRWYDINVIAGTFKSFMRELPEQPLEQAILDELRDITAQIPNEDNRITRYRDVMLRLRPHNYHFLRRVYLHFARVAGNAYVNKMHSVNLAIVFGMGLSPNSNHPFGVSPDLGLYQTMVKTWISYADQIFPELEEDDEGTASVVRTDSVGIPSEPASPTCADSPPLPVDHSPSPAMSLDERRPVTAESSYSLR